MTEGRHNALSGNTTLEERSVRIGGGRGRGDRWEEEEEEG